MYRSWRALDGKWWTPLECALSAGANTETIRLLVEDDPDVGEASHSLLPLAIGDNQDGRIGHVKADSSILWAGNQGKDTGTWVARKLPLPGYGTRL